MWWPGQPRGGGPQRGISLLPQHGIPQRWPRQCGNIDERACSRITSRAGSRGLSAGTHISHDSQSSWPMARAVEFFAASKNRLPAPAGLVGLCSPSLGLSSAWLCCFWARARPPRRRRAKKSWSEFQDGWLRSSSSSFGSVAIEARLQSGSVISTFVHPRLLGHLDRPLRQSVPGRRNSVMQQHESSGMHPPLVASPSP